MKIYEYTNKGSREINQDFVIHSVISSNTAIMVVADGMGGYSFGEIASQVIGESIVEFVRMNISNFSPTELLKESIIYANDCLMLKRLSLGVKSIGAVVSVLLTIENEAYFTWLGDSRLYLYRDGIEVYRTKDHSVINELSKIKTLKSSDIDRYSSVVTRSIMGDDRLGKAEVSHVSVQQGDIFVLCTDGFHKELAMSNATEYNDSYKDLLDSKSANISDNYSFIKFEV
ncbi:PP2C family protein-serine/threonine phosphatase [Bacteroides nordii]|jgi:serine/threonine protein phosphatase PrpC|uniref:PP2C family protein-serine/threonine phosphatase n=1 Tax=Bacteroides nordii TaxID=291645 RepID=UPI0035201C34